MKNGEITTEPNEVYAVEEIFGEYLKGKSLLQIAKLMEFEKIKYTEDSGHWNKNMVKRIIENEKYLGTDKYPQLIDDDNLIFTSCIIPLKYAIISKLPMIYNIETNVKHV